MPWTAAHHLTPAKASMRGEGTNHVERLHPRVGVNFRNTYSMRAQPQPLDGVRSHLPEASGRHGEEGLGGERLIEARHGEVDLRRGGFSETVAAARTNVGCSVAVVHGDLCMKGGKGRCGAGANRWARFAGRGGAPSPG